MKQVEELLKYIDAKEFLNEIGNWDVNVFPVHGMDLMLAGVEKGKRMRAVLKYLFELWKKVDFLKLNFYESKFFFNLRAICN